MSPALPTAAQDAARPTARRAGLGWSGFLFVFITVFLAVGAVNSQNNLLFWVFGLSVAAVIVSGVISGNSLLGLRLLAHDVPDTPVGSATPVAYTVISRNRTLPVFALSLREADVPDAARGCLLHVAPRGVARASVAWTPRKRGPVDFNTITVESRFPFGFIIKSLRFDVPRRALATPPVIELDPAIIKSLGEGHTEDRVKRARRDATGAYFGLRPYSPGDPRRTIAWRPSARRSELLVVEHAEPRGRSVWVHLGPPAGAPAHLAERAIAMAAALVAAGTRTGRPVGVWAPWAGLRLAPATGQGAQSRAAAALALLDLTAPPGADVEPPLRPGESVVRIPLGAGQGSGTDRLDPARPENWLAPGAELPHCLRDPGARP